MVRGHPKHESKIRDINKSVVIINFGELDRRFDLKIKEMW